MKDYSIPTDLRDALDAMHQAREMALTNCRKVTQLSSKSIRNVHRQDYDAARKLLSEAQALALSVRAQLKEFPNILYAGYLQDCEKEVVEAAAMLALALDQPIPERASLGVDITSYLHGLGEAASESRRFVLDQMRTGSLAEAERLLDGMVAIYEELITLDYPDGMTGGLRRTCDALRAVVERTRSDLTLTCMQRELLDQLKRVKS